MKIIRLASYGAPDQVARCVDQPDPSAPDAGEALFEVLAFPINPADLSFCRGQYRLRPPLPATPGAECIGRVLAIGESVQHLQVGDLVINLQRENWTSLRRCDAADLIPLPPDIDIRQGAMLRINPATALLLLTDLRPLEAGDWVIQNVGNSAVGRWVMLLAQQMGLRTVNVVRRQSLFAEMYSLGADVCVVDGPELAARVRAETGQQPIGLALDAVGGQATTRLASCVADGGLVCHYGSMSGEDPLVPRSDFMNRGLNLTGFMLGRFLSRRSLEDITETYQGLARLMQSSKVQVPIRQVYPIDAIGEALRHAQQGERGGKILVAPNEPI